jgi:hypothetical protein
VTNNLQSAALLSVTPITRLPVQRDADQRSIERT